MREKPILFSASMVRALLNDRKTQTRRVVNPQPTFEDRPHYGGIITDSYWLGKKFNGLLLPKRSDMWMHCPYGKIGEHLYVKEAVVSEKCVGLDSIEELCEADFQSSGDPFQGPHAHLFMPILKL